MQTISREEVIEFLATLPTDKLAEVYDFARFIGNKNTQTTLARFSNWYQSQCDEDWEHRFGIQIGTFDNPGWDIKIDLDETGLESVQFEEYKDRLEDKTLWLRCWKEETKFNIACGVPRLEDALLIFLNWAEVNRNLDYRNADEL